MLVSFLSPKCNHNKLPLWGTDTFDLYFFMIHVCIYCCAVAHMDNTVPHVWISLNNNRRLNSFFLTVIIFVYSICILSFLQHFLQQIYRQTCIHTHSQTKLSCLSHFHDWQCSVAAGIGWPLHRPLPLSFWLFGWILLLHKNIYTNERNQDRAWPSSFSFLEGSIMSSFVLCKTHLLKPYLMHKLSSSTVNTSRQVNPKIKSMDDRCTSKKEKERETCSLPPLFCLSTEILETNRKFVALNGS